MYKKNESPHKLFGQDAGTYNIFGAITTTFL